MCRAILPRQRSVTGIRRPVAGRQRLVAREKRAVSPCHERSHRCDEAVSRCGEALPVCPKRFSSTTTCGLQRTSRRTDPTGRRRHTRKRGLSSASRDLRVQAVVPMHQNGVSPSKLASRKRGLLRTLSDRSLPASSPFSKHDVACWPQSEVWLRFLRGDRGGAIETSYIRTRGALSR